MTQIDQDLLDVVREMVAAEEFAFVCEQMQALGFIRIVDANVWDTQEELLESIVELGIDAMDIRTGFLLGDWAICGGQSCWTGS